MQWISWDMNLKIRLIGETLFNLLFWMYFPFIALYFSDAMGKETAGILMSVPPLIGMIGGMLGGYVSDRFGRRPAMLFGAFLKTGMFAVFAFSNSHWFDYLAFIGIGLAGSIYGPASSAMVADLTPEKDRRKVFATFVTAMNVGAVLGPALGSVFFFHYRTGLLWTCTLVMLFYSSAIYFIIRETRPRPADGTEQTNAILPAIKDQWNSYALIFRDKVFALYIAAGIFVMIAFMQLDLYLAVYVSDYVPAQTLLSWKEWSFNLSSVEVFGWMMGLNGLLFVLFVLPVTKWLEHWSERNILILSAVLFGSGMFMVGLTTNVWLLFAFMIILTVGEFMRSPVMQSFVSKYAPADARGRYMAASNLQFSIGRLIAPVTVVLSAWMPPILVFGFILLCTVISAVLYVRLFQIMPAIDQGNTPANSAKVNNAL
ncbi:MDR family MFS transporter [Paenibacillus alkalitolerans]|uniref:MDR family MFS transporter n=1 Tax=Paenibacillus alkalitolerans TaxID=2799335 RepID=UPI0018F2CE73|nr:MFS transporter [Paenibacillus alkalitolerans]